jgi:hypothetical protein
VLQCVCVCVCRFSVPLCRLCLVSLSCLRTVPAQSSSLFFFTVVVIRGICMDRHCRLVCVNRIDVQRSVGLVVLVLVLE